jgi:CDP-diacylglycerol--glycerol-3-phosphate 3-phosphatidyltransferase
MFRGKILTPSNGLSLIRVLLLIPITYALSANSASGNLWALIFMLVAIVTDFLDGYLARTMNQVSDFGKVLDPFADKVCIVGVCLILASPLRDNPIPIWILAVLVARDLSILMGGYLMYRRTTRVVTSNIWGKSTSVVVSLMIISYVLKLEPSQPLLSWLHYRVLTWLAFSFLIVSGITYAWGFYLVFGGRKQVVQSGILDSGQSGRNPGNPAEN